VRMVVKYAKQDRVKHISHLDLVRTLHRALRRAEIPVAFSQGYNPQPKVAFAPPLSVGMTSEGEYLDVVLVSCLSPQEFCQRMNSVLPKGIAMLKGVEIEQSTPSLMSMIERALYTIRLFNNPYRDFGVALEEFLKQPELMVAKSGKKGERIINIKPMIHELSLVSLSEEQVVMKAMLSAGSKESLNPEHLIRVFFDFLGAQAANCCLMEFHRLDMFLYSRNIWITPLELGRGGWA